MDNTILNIENLSKSFFTLDGEVEVLKNLNLSLKEGEKIAIVGPSGCGKSTILNLISGLIKPSKGSIDLKGDVGYMFQKDNLLEWRTVLGNVYLGLELQKRKTKENIEYVNNLLKKYNLWDFKDKYPKELSGGMRQRVALIRTLALKPSILLLDEAFSALDYQTRLDVCDDVYKIIKDEKLTAILVTHDIGEAISLSDKIIILSSRPASVKTEINIELGHIPTPFERRENIYSQKYFDKIWSDLK